MWFLKRIVMKIKILFVFGTRPEAIKMAILIKEIQKQTNFIAKICVTRQHNEMLNQVLNLFGIVPDYDLDIMRENQSLEDITSSILLKMRNVINDFKPNRILVHGDTTTTFAATLSAYYHHTPVAHIEAGLRTGNIYSPFPEEINRKLTSSIADIHFAPTVNSKKNLLSEGISEDNIYVTGNTVIDALVYISSTVRKSQFLQSNFSYLLDKKKLILVTGHRRENFGNNFENICLALKEISKRNDVQIVYPVHLNPNIKKIVIQLLGNCNNIQLIQPLAYDEFVYLMNKSYLILTDSGGVQEEAPTLSKPILIIRDTTERPEVVETGAAKLIGTKKSNIVREVSKLLDKQNNYHRMSKAKNPYGDGKASKKIVDILLKKYENILLN